jgi:hypothetical protein
LGDELAEHNQLQVLEVGFAAQVGEDSEQQVDPFARVVTAAHGAKQQQRAVLRQTPRLTG